MPAPVDRKMEYVDSFCSNCRAITKHHRSTPSALWTCEHIDSHTELPRKITSIYVAGASAEFERAETILGKLRTPPLSRFFHITKDWPGQVRTERVEGGRHDHELDLNLQRRIEAEDVAAVFEAEILWLLLPPPHLHTVGMWFELGVGRTKRLLAQQLSDRLLLRSAPTPYIICSQQRGHYLFAANVDRAFDSDDAALEWVASYAQSAKTHD